MESGLYPDDIEGNIDQKLPYLSSELCILYEESKALGRDLADVIDLIENRVSCSRHQGFNAYYLL